MKLSFEENVTNEGEKVCCLFRKYYPREFHHIFSYWYTCHQVNECFLLQALTPVMETLHPLSIINHAHMRSLSTVEGQNTLKKKRYMYWSRLRDKRVAGTPEQSAILSTTYQESCFQQMQGQVTVPRVRLQCCCWGWCVVWGLTLVQGCVILLLILRKKMEGIEYFVWCVCTVISLPVRLWVP